MKLYATTTSERASKGQGGNNRIDFILNDELKNSLCAVFAEVRDNEIYVEFLDCSGGAKHIYSYDLPKQKGEKLKTAKHNHLYVHGICSCGDES